MPPFQVTKAPDISGWPDLEITDKNIEQYFNAEEQNISVLLGKETSCLIDIDLDCAEAGHFAADLLPNTSFRYGRKSNPCSHYLYHVPDIGESFRFEYPI